MEKVITVTGLSKIFETKGKKGQIESFTAVDNISFEAEQGEIIGFIGPNGAGKSTTIKMMTGILYPSAGDVTICGFNSWKERQAMSYNIATMFGQKSCLLAHLPVIESYKLLGAIYDIDKKTLEERINEVAELCDIHELLHKKTSSLSLGQRMICEVASVALHRPRVIFLDEPTIGLDIVVKKKVRRMIRTLNKKYGTTIFITSHDISDIEKLCDRVIIINHGKKMLDSKLEDIKNDFLTKKKIEVSYDEQISQESTTEILSDNRLQVGFGEKMTVEFDENIIQVGDVIEKLVKLGKVQDLSISNTSLENVIYDIYTTSKGG